MLDNNITQTDSKYFDFKTKKENDGLYIYHHVGWSGLTIIKFDIKKGKNLDGSFIDSLYPDLYKKEKIFVNTKGSLDIKSLEYQFSLEKFDAVDLISGSQGYQITCLEDSTVFIISSNNLTNYNEKPIFFNFKKNIETKDLWGGQCISRPYEGKGLTLVLFDLKEGFKFEDKGHSNQQITWVINGSVDFYANDNRQTLTPDNGLDIGPNHKHGGVSAGAIGFDAFFPKRNEIKYKK